MPFQRALLRMALATVLVGIASSRDAADTGDRDVVWQPAAAWEYSGLFTVGNHGIPLDYDPVLLSLGRSVYADLQQARRAALNREAANLWVSLQEARETIHQLRLPYRQMALNVQLQEIRNDLRDSGKTLDHDMWVPVEAEIDEVRVYVPGNSKHRAGEPVGKGRKTAGKEDRENAAQQPDIITAFLQYSLGIFPLSGVGHDLEAATVAAQLPGPDWAGTLEAIEQALAKFRWYTRSPTHGLLAVYNDVVSAYALASAPHAIADPQQQVHDYLSKAQNRLRHTPGGMALVPAVQDLLHKVDTPAGDIKLFLGRLRTQIMLDQRHIGGQFPDAIGGRPGR